MNIYHHGELWGDGAGAADALTDTYQAGPWIYTGVDSTVLVSLVLSGADLPTSLELQVEWKDKRTGAIQALDLRSIVVPGSGIVDVDPKTYQITPGAFGNYALTLVLPGYSVLRLKAKRTGGASDPDLLAVGDAVPAIPFDCAGGGGGGGGGGTLLEASASGQAEGDRDLAIGADAFLLKAIHITTSSRDWTLTLYRSDDHATGPLEVLTRRHGDVHLSLDLPWTDADASSELHYTWTDNAGTATHDIAVAALELETP